MVKVKLIIGVICQARLPGDKFGHNHHFWIGRGSSAYDFNCRISANSDAENHVLNNCGCSFCVKETLKDYVLMKIVII